jgi:hypothetical protein
MQSVADPSFGAGVDRHGRCGDRGEPDSDPARIGVDVLVSVRMASTLMYEARRKKLAATSCCARRSAMCELRRLPVKSQSTTPPASASMRLSTPKPISAIANSPTCGPIPAQARSRGRR